MRSHKQHAENIVQRCMMVRRSGGREVCCLLGPCKVRSGQREGACQDTLMSPYWSLWRWTRLSSWRGHSSTVIWLMGQVTQEFSIHHWHDYSCKTSSGSIPIMFGQFSRRLFFHRLFEFCFVNKLCFFFFWSIHRWSIMVYETKFPRQHSSSTVTEDCSDDSEVQVNDIHVILPLCANTGWDRGFITGRVLGLGWKIHSYCPWKWYT